MYAALTFGILMIISQTASPIGANHNLKRVFAMFASLLNLHSFLFVYMPSVQNFYSYSDMFNLVKMLTALRNIAQAALAITIITIVCVND